MNFSIFDLYQGGYCQSQSFPHVSGPHPHIRASRQESPDSMKWEDEETGRTGQERGNNETREVAEVRPSPAVSRAVLLAADWEDLRSLSRDSTSSKSKRPSEVHSYSENKHYWDCLNSRKEQSTNGKKALLQKAVSEFTLNQRLPIAVKSKLPKLEARALLARPTTLATAQLKPFPLIRIKTRFRKTV